MKLLVVDDEAPARERLGRMLGTVDPGAQIDFATNGYEALEKIKLNPPDILFLDIQMPEMSGFDILQNIESRSFAVIFQTAYDQFAIKAFEESACDYLLKPFELDRLKKAYVKATSEVGNGRAIQNLSDNLKAKDHFLEKIPVKQGNSLFKLETKDILFFTSKDHYTCARTKEKELILDLSLTHLENHLNPNKFFRCHRSHIVAIQKIKSLALGPQMYAVFNDDERIEVSRQNRATMRDLIKK